MINLLMGILFAGFIKRHRFNIRKTHRKFKKESKFIIEVLKDIFRLKNRMFKFILKMFNSIANNKKNICSNETVEEIKNENIIDFTEYKLKKAK